MNTTKKIAIGLGLAGGAVFAAWLLTGDRKKKTKDFIAKKTQDLKNNLTNLKHDKPEGEDDVTYV